MGINKLVQSFALCAVLVLVAFKATAGYIDTQRDVEPGVWTSDYNGAMAYAEANNIPMFVLWANNGCSHCEAVEKEMNKVRITAIRQTVYNDLIEQYENSIEHACDIRYGQQWIS